MKRCGLFALLVVLMTALPTLGSTFLAMNQQDLIRNSKAVIDGKVLLVDSFWDDDNRIIMSEAIIEVRETVAGKASTLVTVRTIGGEVDGYVIEAHGFPTFAVGEKLLLFLGREQDGAMRVTGYQQGQFRIVTDHSNVEQAIPVTDQDVNILSYNGQAASRPKTQPLEDLKNAIRTDARRIGLSQQ